MDQLPWEIFDLIFAYLPSKDLNQFLSITSDRYKQANDTNTWLQYIDNRYRINFTTQTAFTQLIKLIENNLLIQPKVMYFDRDTDRVEPLGNIFINVADTIGSLISRLIDRYGILGIIYLSDPQDDDDFTGDRYTGPDTRVEFDQFEEPFCGFDFSALLLGHQIKNRRIPLSIWFNKTFAQAIPQPFYRDMEIVIEKYQYTPEEIAQIHKSLKSKY